MSDKDFAKLMEIAQERIEAVKTMTKKEAIEPSMVLVF